MRMISSCSERTAAAAAPDEGRKVSLRPLAEVAFAAPAALVCLLGRSLEPHPLVAVEKAAHEALHQSPQYDGLEGM
jgi:hypothetical protein